MDYLTTAISGVLLVPLRQIPDERGVVLHMLREDASFFTRFGEIYFSEIRPWVVKAWRRHARMTQRFAVPAGRVQFALFDARPDSTANGQSLTVVLGRPDAYQLLVVPPLIWYGFQGVADVPSIIANCPDLAHDPTESEASEQCPGLPGYQWQHPRPAERRAVSPGADHG